MNIDRMLRDLFCKTNVTVCHQKQRKRAKINASLHNFNLDNKFSNDAKHFDTVKNASFANY